MDSSLEKDSLRKFIKISKWLKSNHLSSPEIYIKDEKLWYFDNRRFWK